MYFYKSEMPYFEELCKRNNKRYVIKRVTSMFSGQEIEAFEVVGISEFESDCLKEDLERIKGGN